MNCSKYIFDHALIDQSEKAELELIQILESITENYRENTHYSDLSFNSKALGLLNKYTQHPNIPTISIPSENPDDKSIIYRQPHSDKISPKEGLSNLIIPPVQDPFKTNMQGKCLSIYGAVHEFGMLGIQVCKQKAFHFYKQSTILKNPFGTYSLAKCFEFGIGTIRDPEKACIFYRLSYKLGHIKGLHRYSLILIKGNGFVEKDIPTGYHLLKLAVAKATHEYPNPCYDLGMFYKARDFHILTDHRYAFQIFLKGAKLGCNNCQYKVAEEYEKGEYVPKDIERAFYWYKMAADSGQSDAQKHLAQLLLKDNSNPFTSILQFQFIDKPNRLKEARNYALKSATKGNIGGIKTLGEIYENGLGVETNLMLALWWYRIGYFYQPSVFENKILVLEKVIGIKNTIHIKKTGILGNLINRIKNL